MITALVASLFTASSLISMAHMQDNTARINSIDFHRKEDLLITGADDDSIHLYNTATGELQEVFFSKVPATQMPVFDSFTAGLPACQVDSQGDACTSMTRSLLVRTLPCDLCRSMAWRTSS
jgi:WD40 repeat protein